MQLHLCLWQDFSPGLWPENVSLCPEPQQEQRDRETRMVWGCLTVTARAWLCKLTSCRPGCLALHPAGAARAAEAADYKAAAHRLIILSGLLSRPGCRSAANAGNFKRSRAVDNKIHSGMFLTKQGFSTSWGWGPKWNMTGSQTHLSDLARLFWAMRNGLKIMPGPPSISAFVIYPLVLFFF